MEESVPIGFYLAEFKSDQQDHIPIKLGKAKQIDINIEN